LALQGRRARAATPELLAQLGHPDPGRRRNAAKTLAVVSTPALVEAAARRLGEGDQHALALRLLRSLEEDGRDVTEFAARAIGQMMDAADVTVPRLVRLLATGDAARRRLAVDAIAAIGPVAAEALPELAGAVYDDTYEVRVGAALAVTAVRR